MPPFSNDVIINVMYMIFTACIYVFKIGFAILNLAFFHISLKKQSYF